MNDRLSASRIFWRGVTAGRDLNVPKPTVSGVKPLLEREPGGALFTGTTRVGALVDAGSGFLRRIEPILAEVQDGRSSGELREMLRFGLSFSFVVRELATQLPVFTERQPRVLPRRY